MKRITILLSNEDTTKTKIEKTHDMIWYSMGVIRLFVHFGGMLAEFAMDSSCTPSKILALLI